MGNLTNEILLNIRKNHKLSRNGLESISGFKARTIESYERAESKPSKEYIEFISLYFGIPDAYIRGESEIIKLDEALQQVLMYQSIYNYDDEKMAEILGIVLVEIYEQFKVKNKIYHPDFKDNILLKLNIAENLQIKSSKFWITKEYFLKDTTGEFNNDLLNVLEEKYNLAEQNGIDITPEYYASIIKKRNQPETTYTPISKLSEIPEKFKEILELLPFAPDSFIDTLTDKLKAMRDAQKL